MNAPDLFPEPRLYNGQLYVAIATRPHTCLDGRETILAIWESACADCGAAFTTTTPLHASRFEPSRRCQRHKRPGQPVRSARA